MPRLLLIDDDDLLRDVLARVLTEAGHTVLTAADGRRALEQFRAGAPDLIITDLVMPDREGLEVIMLLHREHPALPIIAMSGQATHSRVYLAMAASLGAHRTLAKPFHPSTLLRAIDELLPPPSRPPPGSTDENPPS